MKKRNAYLGSVFLPFFMLMIILEATNNKHAKYLHGILGIIAIIVFLIAASPGILDIYYKEVSFMVTNGVSTLVKVYSPLHLLYLFYLLGYLASMIVVIIRVQVKKTIDTARIEVYVNGLNRLTATERAIYDAYIARLTTKEIMANLNIKENTLKYHNKNIYSKLGVSSRKELQEIYKQLKFVKANLDSQQ